jgi:hypothetical protein
MSRISAPIVVVTGWIERGCLLAGPPLALRGLPAASEIRLHSIVFRSGSARLLSGGDRILVDIGIE